MARHTKSGSGRSASPGAASPRQAFRPDTPPPVDPWGETLVQGGLTLREAIPPGHKREDALRNIRQHYEALAMSLDPAVEELRGLVAAHEPVQLISSIVIPANMRFFERGDALSDAPDTVSWPAKIEYLVGVALSLPAGTGSTPMAVSRRVMDLVSDVFDAMHAREMIDSFDRASSGNSSLDEALFMLRMEHLVDRMPGYPVHLERIDAEVFDRHGSYYIDALGFNPGDVVRVVRRRGQAVQQRADQALSQARRSAGRDIEASALAAMELVQTMTETRTWTPAQVATDTGVPEAQISKMLAFFATTFGAQPEFRLPTDSNLARTNPAIDLGADAYFIPDTWTLAAAVHPRLAAASSDGELGRYRSHREQGHERLLTNSLRQIFPADLVHSRQHYDSDKTGHGEIDVLVSLEWPLIVEAKAHGLTEPGRRGAPLRVQRVAGDVIDKAIEQTHRAVAYIVDDDGRRFAAAEGEQSNSLLPDNITGTTEVIVTFERMDPLAMLGVAVVGQQPVPVWVVGLADFLVVCDILDDPSELHHYARTRASTAVEGPVVYVESDALGGYLVNRLEIPASDDDQIVMLGYSSDAINAYFTARELGQRTSKPTSGVDRDVLNALAELMTRNAGTWSLAVDAVLQTPPEVWRRWRRFRRRHRRRGAFLLTPGLLLAGSDHPEPTSKDGLVLQVPDVT